MSETVLRKFRSGAPRFSLVPNLPDPTIFRAGGHRGAVIPVPMPNTEVKGAIAEGSVGPAHARVGRRRPFFVPCALCFVLCALCIRRGDFSRSI